MKQWLNEVKKVVKEVIVVIKLVQAKNRGERWKLVDKEAISQRTFKELNRNNDILPYSRDMYIVFFGDRNER